jgi:uncharacterized LabA/DUF88 family protein
MHLTEPRLKIAVFIDFDNIEIGVKSTLGGHFDVGSVLEAIKERGEVVTKTAYGDWKRAGEHSRQLTQHAIKMVQRNVTPGGDKNGADINLALDALELAFTHDHINAFVIVGGDSDFITLVEKLKQYDKKVFVLGGRAFTSVILQKNCHEFIAYENLVAAPARRSTVRGRPVSAGAAVGQALPLVKRALKVLTDREVSPQLGLLKSTLLQLDSTFSERDYGASTFRDFIEKVAETGLVHLKPAGRSFLVELRDPHLIADDGEPAAVVSAPPPADGQEAIDVKKPAAPADPGLLADGIRRVRSMFESAPIPTRWPMYLRNVKQFLKSKDGQFDERRFGFGSLVDLLRACQREGFIRLDRDRQGVLRVYPGQTYQPATPAAEAPGLEAFPTAEAPSFEAIDPGRLESPMQSHAEEPGGVELERAAAGESSGEDRTEQPVGSEAAETAEALAGAAGKPKRRRATPSRKTAASGKTKTTRTRARKTTRTGAA